MKVHKNQLKLLKITKVEERSSIVVRDSTASVRIFFIYFYSPCHAKVITAKSSELEQARNNFEIIIIIEIIILK
jgi:hypothetical protein